ncbi:hypothetical protein ABZ490_12265 [Streptomyces sp. NPDC005811]
MSLRPADHFQPVVFDCCQVLDACCTATDRVLSGVDQFPAMSLWEPSAF